MSRQNGDCSIRLEGIMRVVGVESRNSSRIKSSVSWYYVSYFRVVGWRWPLDTRPEIVKDFIVGVGRHLINLRPEMSLLAEKTRGRAKSRSSFGTLDVEDSKDC